MKRCSFLLGMIILTVLFSSVNLAHAQENLGITVVVDKPYYLRGQSITVTIYSNPNTQVRILVINPNNVTIRDVTRTTDGSGYLSLSDTIPSNAAFGTYTVQALIVGCKAETWFTVVDTTNLAPTVFPFQKTHQGLDYTFYSNSTIKVHSGTDELTIQFPNLKVPGITITCRNNSRILHIRIRKNSIGLIVDLTFTFIHKGMKFVVNGTLPSANSFTFRFSKTEAKKLVSLVSCIKSGSIVFDWSDLKKAGKHLSYNIAEERLTVTIPPTFNLDPYIFEDDFESNDFSAWDGTTVSSGCSLAIQSSVVFEGSYSANSTVNTSYADALCYVSFTTDNPLYVHLAVHFTSFPAAYGELRFLRLLHPGAYSMYRLSIYVDASSNKKLRFRYYIPSDTTIEYQYDFQVDTWYEFEVKSYVDDSAGEYRVYLDNTEVLNATGLNTTSAYSWTQIQVGIGSSACDDTTIYLDDVAVDDEYIGAGTYTLTLQARDKDGANLPRQVTYKGTFANSSTFEEDSNSNGLKALTVASGTHTVNTWWGTHLIDSSRSVEVAADKTENIDTKIARLDSGSYYILISINETSLPSPSLVGTKDWKMWGVSGSGSKQLKVDVANWIDTNEPEILKINGNPYETGWTWDSANHVFTYLLDLSGTAINIEMSWSTPSRRGGTTTVPATSTTEQEEEGVSEVPVEPYIIPEYTPEVSIDTFYLALTGIAILVVGGLVYWWWRNQTTLATAWNTKKKGTPAKWKKGKRSKPEWKAKK